MYRARARACPACAAPMEGIPVELDPDDASARAEIDRCATCGGLFLEFFDGEPGAISRGLGRRSDLAPTGGRGSGGELTCPDCGEAMVIRAYLDQGPEVPRCETCLAVFLTPALREQMAQMRVSPEPVAEAPGWVARLLRWLDRA